MTDASDTGDKDSVDAAIAPPVRVAAPARSFHNLPPVPENEVEISAIRAQGAGGQNVNKVSSAVHLRFAIAASSLPAQIKERLFALSDQRITKDGVIVIKSQVHRSQEKNRADALQKLNAIIAGVALAPKARRPTRPTRSSQTKRMDGKTQRGQVKTMRGKVKI
ncbi:MAG: protein chain release factor [Herbaspirillum sp.]|jgi:ribosome-associated protein|nr:protein chain release factor [Herbaspirillum sp.]